MNRTAGVLLVFLAACSIKLAVAVPTGNNSLRVDSEDAKLRVPELIAKYGYHPEIHTVQTEDGYKLTIHRLRKNIERTTKVVFLMHSLLGSSADFLLIGPEKALAYQLADQGYDVWLGNARGSRYSRKHRIMSPNLHAFWNFSWHEIGYYDLPAMIDHVLQTTGQPKLHYIGYSQGTTTFFVLTSTRPEYNEKISLMQALAPVGFMEHMGSPLLLFLEKFLDTLNVFFQLFGIDEFLPYSTVLYDLAKLICPTSMANNLCVNVLFMLAGCDPSQVDPTLIPILLGHTPAGAATKQVMHFAQQISTKGFHRYDYGKLKNVFLYGNEHPPTYNLTEISAPVLFYYGMNDMLSSPVDIRRLGDSLPNLVNSIRVDHDDFNHLDFMLANDVRELLYDKVVENIARAD